MKCTHEEHNAVVYEETEYDLKDVNVVIVAPVVRGANPKSVTEDGTSNMSYNKKKF